MAYQLNKISQYQNVGGINTRASVYVTDKNSVLDLVNYDFQVTGAWNKRWGFTNAISGIGTSIGTDNFFFYGFNYTFQGQTAFDGFNGFSLQRFFVGQTGFFDQANNRLDSFSTAIYPTVAGNGNMVTVQGPSLSSDLAVFTSGGFLYKYYHTWFDNGSTFQLQNQPYYFGQANNRALLGGLPSPRVFFGLSIIGTTTVGSTNIGFVPGTTYNLAVGTLDGTGYHSSVYATLAFTVGSTASGVAIHYRYNGDQFSKWGPATAYFAVDKAVDKSAGELWPTKYSDILAVSASQTANISIGATSYVSTTGQFSLENSNVPIEPDRLQNTNYASAVAFYNSRLWVITGQRLSYSEPIENLADAQDFQPANFFDLSDSQYNGIGIFNFNQSLLIFLQKEIRRLTGDNPNNFAIDTLNVDLYGLINQNCIVEWLERIWFLDEKKIMQFNGSSFEKVSDDVDSFLQTMDVALARRIATVTHLVDRKEIVFAFPSVGSTVNDVKLIYCYLDGVNAWRRDEGYNPSFLSQLYRGLTYIGSTLPANLRYTDNRLYHGAVGGSQYYFGTEFKNDAGQGITLKIVARNHSDQGKSTTYMWRRLFLDTGAFSGATLNFNVNMYANYATAAVSATATIQVAGSQYSGQQQTRIDFGVMGKAFRPELVHGSTTGDVTVFGYTVEGRYLRNV